MPKPIKLIYTPEGKGTQGDKQFYFDPKRNKLVIGGKKDWHAKLALHVNPIYHFAPVLAKLVPKRTRTRAKQKLGYRKEMGIRGKIENGKLTIFFMRKDYQSAQNTWSQIFTLMKKAGFSNMPVHLYDGEKIGNLHNLAEKNQFK